MEIKISKAGRICAACERDFEHEERVHSLLRASEGQMVREDYCAACWDSKGRGESSYSAWTTRYIDPRIAEQEPPEVFSPLRQLFYEAVEANERRELAKAYLAAQLLRRQKVFRLIKEAEEGEGDVRVALFADRIGDRLIEVRDPNLTYAEMEEGRQALLARLRELESPEPEPSGENTEHAECETR